MNPDGLTQGTVLLYPYLWFRHRSQGETEGRKTRPAAVAFRMGNVMALIPITTREPGRHDLSLEIPEIERKRAGLDSSSRQWLILDELNIDDPTRSYYLEDGSIVGHFSKPFFRQVLGLLRQHVSRVKQVPRR
jgi:hypothetical protein